MLLRVLVLAILSSLLITAAPFTNLFFFGDSLTDTGNIYSATTLLSAATFGLIPVEPPSPPYFSGRFSNGPIWAEYTAARLGQPTDASRASVSLGPLGVIPGSGNNYAIGGARTGLGGALGIFDGLIPTGVLAQVSFYLGSVGAADSGALYFMSGGGNDLRDATKIDDATTRRNTAMAAADYTAYSIYLLYSSGARNFMLMNGPNVGYVPETIASGRINQGIDASMYFNYRLSLWAGLLDQLPGAEIQTFDLFSFYNEVFGDTLQGGAQYGFTSITPCKPGTAGAQPCPVSLFFDDIHPTTRLHQLVGDRIANQVQAAWPNSQAFAARTAQAVAPVPEPASFALVLVAAAGAMVARRKLG